MMPRRVQFNITMSIFKRLLMKRLVFIILPVVMSMPFSTAATEKNIVIEDVPAAVSDKNWEDAKKSAADAFSSAKEASSSAWKAAKEASQDALASKDKKEDPLPQSAKERGLEFWKELKAQAETLWKEAKNKGSELNDKA